jgi:hypothetical protein
VNFFQPSFKLAAKARDGAKVTKRYHPPATPCERLMADARTSEEVRRRLEVLCATLDPVRPLQQIRAAQQELVGLADGPLIDDVAPPAAPTLEQFSGLRTAWQEGEVRPTSAPKPKAKRLWRRPDPFVAVTTRLREWFEAEPWRTSCELFERLQAEYPGVYPDGQLRTCQRRLKDGGERSLFDWYLGPRRSTLSTWTDARLWRRWPAITLWICRYAWTTLARRPQLHRLHNNKQAFEEGLGNFSAGNIRQREHLDEATVACWVTFSGEAIRPLTLFVAPQSGAEIL